MKITWEADDGYAGGAAPHTTNVDDSYIRECETVEEAVDLIEETIREDFRSSIFPIYDIEDITTQVKKMLKS